VRREENLSPKLPLRVEGLVLRLGLAAGGATLVAALGASALSDPRLRLAAAGLAATAAGALALALLRPAKRAMEALELDLAESRRAFELQRYELEAASQRLRLQNDELRRANEVLAQLSVTDGLTRLHNHRHFQDQFAREAKRADRTGQPLALALADIDDFKRLNDQLGHAAGDAVLRRVADVLSAQLRDSDFLSRYGGEEFALLAPQTDLAGAVSLAEKLRLAIARADLAVVGPGGRPTITVSIGVALYDGSMSTTFDAADRALYDAKAAGKDCVAAAGAPGSGRRRS
jgi:diguanylate cyclase (GGDEF)-like protein